MAQTYMVGGTKLMGELAALTANLMRERADACLKACMVFERHAKHYATGYGGGPHVQTGTLRNSIQSRQTAADEAQVAPSTDYAAFVEYGTSRMPAYPYMRPAYEVGVKEAGDVLAKHLATAIGGSVGGSIGTSAGAYNLPLPGD